MIHETEPGEPRIPFVLSEDDPRWHFMYPISVVGISAACCSHYSNETPAHQIEVQRDRLARFICMHEPRKPALHPFKEAYRVLHTLKVFDTEEAQNGQYLPACTFDEFARKT